jgi:hypothetical protein
LIAQQLVRLEGAPSYTLQTNYSGGTTRSPLVALHLTCAGPAGEKVLDKTFDLPAGRSVKASLPHSCGYAWVSLILPPDDDPAGRDIRIDSVSMRRSS